MADFQRGLEQLKDKLINESLFNNLKEDIKKNEIFFAIRGGYCSFYLKGSSLFKYEQRGFSTHHKYAFVPQDDVKSYITEKDLSGDNKIAIETRFEDSYEKIKERAALYASVEAEGVSALYKFAPTSENKNSHYFLVDIEIAFDAIKDIENQRDDKKSTDRIDILLYDNTSQKLLFCEAKHFSNKELWAEEGSKPKVIKQLEGYNTQIAEKKDMIIKEYRKAFVEYNYLIGSELNLPTDVHPNCGLLVFGYDRWQEGKIDKLLKDDGSLEGHMSKTIGDILKNTKNKNTVKTIYTALTKG